MSFVLCVLIFGIVVGLVGVASNPSPYFAALGLVVASGMGCGIVVSYGGSFLSLVLFLIYLGGMLVVFAYSAALAAEPYPEGWFSGSVAFNTAMYVLVIVFGGAAMSRKWYEVSVPGDEMGEFSVVKGDVSGVSIMYSFGGGVLVLSAWMLLLALFVVLELTRGIGRGTVRAV